MGLAMHMSERVLLNLRSRGFLIMFGSFLFFVLMLTVGVPTGIPKARGSGFSLTSPAFYPYLVCWAGLAISAVATIGTALGGGAGQAADAPSYPLSTTLVRFVVLLAIFTLNYLLLPQLGALVTMVLVFASMLLLGGERRFSVIAAASVGIPIAAYLIFRDLARVPLPAGILPF